MLYLEIILGVLLCFLAFCSLIGSLDEPALLVAVTFLGISGGFLLSAGADNALIATGRERVAHPSERRTGIVVHGGESVILRHSDDGDAS